MLIILITFMAYVIVGSDSLGNVDETDKEEERNDKKGWWFFISIVVGVLALPLMVVWRGKRDESSRVEWCDIGRHGLTIVFGSCLHLCLLLFTSCSTPQPVVVERMVVKTDTMYKTNVRADTFRILDSVFVNQYTKGDTIYKEKTTWKWRDKVSIKTDTIYKVALQADSVRVPVPVERKLSAWEKIQMCVGKIAVGAIVMIVVSLLLWLIHRKK